MPLYREQAVVLRTYRLGETDRIVSLLTQGRGKVRAVVKGVRKPGSRFGARLEPTSHVALQLYEGRTLDTVTQAESIDAFAGLRDHLDALTAALAMLEVTDQVAQEQESNGPLYRMVVGALRTLADAPFSHSASLVAPAFFWKVLSLEGFHPQVDACIRCDGEYGLVALVPEEGGAVCHACAPHVPGPNGGPALELITEILGGGLRGVLSRAHDGVNGVDGPRKGDVVREVERLALRAVEFHFERRLRSAALLSSA